MIRIRRNILDFSIGPRETPDQAIGRMLMTLWQLRTFATVAKEGSFTKAGKVLQISQPSVSSLVISLQKELGVKLFEKLGMRPHLTEAGRRLLKRAESVLATVDNIPEEMDQLKGLKTGRIVVGGSGFAGSTLLPVTVQAFKKAFPSVEVKLVIQPSPVLEEKLLNGEIDVALMGRAPQSRLIDAKPYREENVVVIAPPDHPLAKRRSVPLEDLIKEPIITDAQHTPVREMVENVFAQRQLSFAPALEIDVLYGSRESIKSAVANGLGIAFITQHLVTLDTQVGRLKVLSVPELKLKRAMYLAVHKRRQSPLVRTFIHFLQDKES
jgi:DNA-binding transcriptional LysR family regulator